MNILFVKFGNRFDFKENYVDEKGISYAKIYLTDPFWIMVPHRADLHALKKHVELHNPALARLLVPWMVTYDEAAAFISAMTPPAPPQPLVGARMAEHEVLTKARGRQVQLPNTADARMTNEPTILMGFYGLTGLSITGYRAKVTARSAPSISKSQGILAKGDAGGFSKRKIAEALRLALRYISGYLPEHDSELLPVRLIYPEIGPVDELIKGPMEQLLGKLAKIGTYVAFSGGADRNSGIMMPELPPGARDLLEVRMTDDLEGGAGLVEGDSALMIDAKGEELLFLVALTSVLMTAVARTKGKTAADRIRLIQETHALRSLIMDVRSREMTPGDLEVIESFKGNVQSLGVLRTFVAQNHWTLSEAIQMIMLATEVVNESA